jgi:Trp operon repressor
MESVDRDSAMQPKDEDATELADADADDAIQEWNAVCELVLKEPEDSVHRKNLEVLLDGIKRKQALVKSLEEAFLSGSKSLDEIKERIPTCIARVYEKVVDKMSNADHEVRQALVLSLEKQNCKWQHLFEGFMARVMNKGDISIAFLSSSGQPDGEVLEADSAPAGKPDDEGLDPDWDSMVQFDPSSGDKIQSFLDSRDRLQEILQAFGDALDHIYEKLTEHNQNVLRQVEEAYGRMYDFMENQQVEIQELVLSNFEHRRELDAALAEAAKKQQNMFSRLMARVSGGTTMTGAASRNGGGGGGLRSMNPLSYVFNRGSENAAP